MAWLKHIAIVALLASCKRFDGRLVASDTRTAIDVMHPILALKAQGCDILKLDEVGVEVRSFDDMVHNPQTGAEVCGYYDGHIVIAHVPGKCATFLHEVAHAIGYRHRTWPPFMWERPPFLPFEEQARQFIELTGCEL